MNKVLILAASLVATGCASTPQTYTYDANSSYALNVVKAAGMSANLEDTQLPKDTVSKMTDSNAFAVGFGAAGYNAPLPGLTSGTTAGLNIAAALLAPKAAATRTTYFGWMPASMASDATSARNKLGEMLAEASKKAGDDLGFRTQVNVAENGTDKSRFNVGYEKSGTACDFKTWKCGIINAARTPVVEKRIIETLPAETGSWFFDPSAGVYSLYQFPNPKTDFDGFQMLRAISSNMPEWFYIYVPPNAVYTNSKTAVKVPLVINKGTVHYFVTAAK